MDRHKLMSSCRKNDDRQYSMPNNGYTIQSHGRFKPLVLASGWLLLTGLLLSNCAEGNGPMLFHRQGCINCHQFQGEGGMLGPDLTAVAQRRSRNWMDQYIQNPAAENIRARMPAFPHLSRAERQALIDFLYE